MIAEIPKIFAVPLGALLLAAIAGPAMAEPPEWSGSPDASITIKTLHGMMRYDLEEIEVAPGAKVKLTLQNADDLQHNLVILKADAQDKDGQKFAQEAWLLGEDGIKVGWVPQNHPRIMAASQLLDPEVSEDLYFVAPQQVGDYPYVCTVPGHSMLMKGILKVQKPGAGLEDLTYSIYEGSWKKLPDFSALKPVKTGKLKDGLIDLGVAKKFKGSVGIVFAGNLRVENEEDHRFYLASDDGARLIINGEGILDRDGIHPMGDPVEAMERLQEGVHSVRVDYFDGGGNRGLALSLRSKTFGNSVLSKDATKGKPKKPALKPILLTPKNGEAITHRAFIAGVSPRAISVGYPGGVNLAWDADLMNLTLLWRGGFIDAAPHWNGRGSSSNIAGFDLLKPGGGLPMQALESLDQPWQADSTATINYERDTAEPQKEITFDVRHPDYRFAGYQLDDQRFPTFRYVYRGKVTVEESFAPQRIDGREALERTIRIRGKVPAGTCFRLTSSGTFGFDDESEWIDRGAYSMKVGTDGIKPAFRSIGDDSDLLAVLDSGADDTTLVITYRWNTKIGGRKK